MNQPHRFTGIVSSGELDIAGNVASLEGLQRLADSALGMLVTLGFGGPVVGLVRKSEVTVDGDRSKVVCSGELSNLLSPDMQVWLAGTDFCARRRPFEAYEGVSG